MLDRALDPTHGSSRSGTKMTLVADTKGDSTTPRVGSSTHLVEVRDGTSLVAVVDHAKKNKSRATALVLVHGFAGNRDENGLFSRTAQAITALGYDVVRYDCRGIRQSTGSYGDSSLEDHAADFAEVVDWARDYVRASRVIAVGFSLGAALVGIALRSHLCALDGVVYWAPAVRPRLSIWPRYNTGEISEQLRARGFIEKGPDKVSVGRPMLDSIRNTDLGPTAFENAVPTLVCHGTEDAKICVDFSEQLAHESTCA